MKEWNSYLKERLTTEEKLAIDLYAQDLDPERRDFFEAMDVYSQLKVSLNYIKDYLDRDGDYL